jgi:glycosyltransferase involved in cell wall biosynthesis
MANPPGSGGAANAERLRIVHVITGPLATGGAEVMLHALIQASDPERTAHEVISLTDLGCVADRIRELGVRTRALGMSRNRLRIPNPLKVLRLASLIRELRPDVVQTWLYHADLIGGIAAKLAGGPRIFWGIHNSTLDRTHSRRTTRWTVAVCARLSGVVPDGIVSVSRAALDLHVSAGYDPEKFTVIPNGFDLTRFRPDARQRRAARTELGVSEGAVVIGLVARMDPQKDHRNFLRAAALLARRRPLARFLLCGEGATADNPALVRDIAEHRLLDRVLLLGRRSDIPRVMNALDVGTLSSAFGEAFPLAIGEAMACGVPCVVTDLGDSAYLVGDTGRVVPPRDPEALAGAWQALVDAGPEARRALGRAARDRVAARFSLPYVADAYAELYWRALGRERSARVGRPSRPDDVRERTSG